MDISLTQVQQCQNRCHSFLWIIVDKTSILPLYSGCHHETSPSTQNSLVFFTFRLLAVLENSYFITLLKKTFAIHPTYKTTEFNPPPFFLDHCNILSSKDEKKHLYLVIFFENMALEFIILAHPFDQIKYFPRFIH